MTNLGSRMYEESAGTAEKAFDFLRKRTDVTGPGFPFLPDLPVDLMLGAHTSITLLR